MEVDDVCLYYSEHFIIRFPCTCWSVFDGIEMLIRNHILSHEHVIVARKFLANNEPLASNQFVADIGY